MRAGDQLRGFAEHVQRQRADQRAEHRAEPADDRPHQRLDRNPGAEGDVGVDEQEILRIERAGERGERRREGRSPAASPAGVDAERLGRILVLAHRNQIGAEAAALDDARQQHRDRRRSRARSRDRAARLWNWKFAGDGSSLISVPRRAAGDRRGIGEDAHHFGEGERDQREIGAAQPERKLR